MGKGKEGMVWSGDLSHDKYGVGHKNQERMSARESRRKLEQEFKRYLKKAAKKGSQA
tara:strand:+ start:921 stop:1091 length:171 start_codon:yes stop_codon:yes gene_type:complete